MTQYITALSMGHRFITVMISMVWVVIFAWSPTQSAHAGQIRQMPPAMRTCPIGLGYLKVVGPPPLRFDPPDTNTLAGLRAIMQVPKPQVMESTNVVAANSMAVATNPVEASAVAEVNPPALATNPVPPANVAPNETVTVEGGNVSGGEGVNNISGNGSSSARDLLPVAASMITEYLKPTKAQMTNQADRPGATVFVPMQMGFTPPAMQSSVPESRAAYHSQ